MAKHTAAPWGVSSQSTNTVKQFDALGETSVIIASVMGGKTSGPFFPEDDGEVAANTLLIAAAPDLLDALQALMDEAVTSVEYSDWPELQAAVEKAQQAIDKATGQCLKGEE